MIFVKEDKYSPGQRPVDLALYLANYPVTLTFWNVTSFDRGSLI